MGLEDFRPTCATSAVVGYKNKEMQYYGETDFPIGKMFTSEGILSQELIQL